MATNPADYLAFTNTLREQAAQTPEAASSVAEATAVAPVTPAPLASYIHDGIADPFDPGASPSRIDVRDRFVSALYTPGDVTAGPPPSAVIRPLGPVLLQDLGKCVAFGLAGALEHVLLGLTGKPALVDADQFFAEGGGNPTYGWEIADALAVGVKSGLYIVDPAGGKPAQLVKLSGYYRVPHTAADLEAATYQATRHPERSPVLWETGWPNAWFAPARGTGLLAPGERSYSYGHLTYLWRYLPRVYGSPAVTATGRNSWSAAWGINGNYEVAISDVLAPELCWGLWQFTLDPVAARAAVAAAFA